MTEQCRTAAAGAAPAQRERWKPVVSYEDLYEVSDQGRVRSLQARNRWPAGRILRPAKNSRGYMGIGLSNGQMRSATVHRLVAEAFIGPPPTPHHEINHKDGDRTNNRACNLEWVTHRQNAHHARDVLGFKPKRMTGAERNLAKLTEQQVIEIRRRYAESGVSMKDIAADYGIHAMTVRQVVRRLTWKHVTQGCAP